MTDVEHAVADAELAAWLHRHDAEDVAALEAMVAQFRADLAAVEELEAAADRERAQRIAALYGVASEVSRGTAHVSREPVP